MVCQQARDATNANPTRDPFTDMELTILGGGVDIDLDRVTVDPATVRTQVQEYAEGSRTDFSIPVEYADGLTGRVMAAMKAIPYGETRTYGDIATELDTAPQAVGQAAGRNPVPIIVPCHRVVSKEGLGGYSAAGGTSLKERLLRHEGAIE